MSLTRTASNCSYVLAHHSATRITKSSSLASTSYLPSYSTRFKSTRPEPTSLSSSTFRLLESANDLLSSLRLKAANALTHSLSEEERQKLLARFSSSNDVEAPTQVAATISTVESYDMPKSIAEAVAAARVEESQKLNSQWEQEKVELVTEIERATRKRIESELAMRRRNISSEQTQRDLQQYDITAEIPNSPVEAIAAAPVHTAVVVPTAEAENFVTAVSEHHPLLGPVLVDLGNKRLHIVAPETLQHIPVWEKQRTFRPDRAKAMAKDKMKTLHLGLLGVITLHENAEGKLSIIDGQHRVGMMAFLKKHNADMAKLGGIVVEVVTQKENDDPSHAQEIFLEINKSEPVKLIDLPGLAPEADRKTITDAALRLKEAFPEMFKESGRCRAPHLNIDNLRDQLFAADVVKRHGIKNSKSMEQWLRTQNELLAKKYAQPETRSKVHEKVLAKADKFNFYLGLDVTWLYA